MAPKSKIVGSMEVVEYPTGEAAPKAPSVIDFVCGMRKVGPRAYSLVTGKLVDGVPSLNVDTVSQPLEHAAEELRLAFQKLMVDIP